MNITGIITSESKRPVQFPKLAIYLVRSGMPDLRFDVDVDSKGEFHLRDDERKCASHTLRFEVKEYDGHQALTYSHEATSEDVHVRLNLGPRNKSWWDELLDKLSGLRAKRRPVLIGAAAVVLAAVIPWVRSCITPVNIPMEVSVLVRSPKTNVTLLLPSKKRVRKVTVGLNDETPREYQNSSSRSKLMRIDDEKLRTLELLRFVVTRIDEEEPVVHVITPPELVEVEEAALYLKEAVVATERIAAGMTQLALVRSQPKPDRAAEKQAADSLDYWKREYERTYLTRLAKYKRDVLSDAAQRFKPGGAYAAHQNLLDVMLPLIGNHLTRLKEKGVLPNAFEKDIYEKYKGLRNALNAQ